MNGAQEGGILSVLHGLLTSAVHDIPVGNATCPTSASAFVVRAELVSAQQFIEPRGWRSVLPITCHSNYRAVDVTRVMADTLLVDATVKVAQFTLQPRWVNGGRMSAFALGFCCFAKDSLWLFAYAARLRSGTAELGLRKCWTTRRRLSAPESQEGPVVLARLRMRLILSLGCTPFDRHTLARFV